jgi:hypothetical protein
MFEILISLVNDIDIGMSFPLKIKISKVVK